MSILTVKNLNHSFGGREILKDVNFRLLKGEHVGLIGANGEGKSSFMNIITGKLEPDEGQIEWSKRVRVGYLDQHATLEKGMTIKDILKNAFKYLFDLEEEMQSMYMSMGDANEKELSEMLEDVGTIQDTLDHNDFYITDAKIDDVSRGLGLTDIGLEKEVQQLSGGQRSKVLLAKLLLEKPDILMLDEPTNYLDEEHIEWLRRYLNKYENAFLLISHDIPFLNSVINLIYHVEDQDLSRYVGNYDDFQKVYEAKKSQLEAAYKKQQQEIAGLEDFIQRNKARVATRNMAMSRQKKLDKMDLIELSKEKPKPRFQFKEGRTAGKEIFKTENLVIGYEEPLTKTLNLLMERGQKIALTGANGLGKTALLKSILGLVPAYSGEVELGQNLEIGYFEQESSANNSNTCIEEMWQMYPGWTQFEIRAALAQCGLMTKHIESKVMVLSGGEQAKVRLCKVMNKETNILLLDEPTNHLDVDAREELIRTLKNYKGGILLISHDPDFYNEVATQVWNCEGWTTKIF
ncbi:MAG: ABC-F family ATP-binding cassette domain-containing protein [Bacillota bacterium]